LAVPAYPEGRKQEGQNYSVPLCFTTQFSQIINAALFCAAFPRSIKGRRKAGTKKPGSGSISNQSPKGKHGKHCAKAKVATPPGVLPVGARARGANPHAPLALPSRYKQQSSGANAARVFNISRNDKPTFLAPQSSAI
jgi:hypothetical protein